MPLPTPRRVTSTATSITVTSPPTTALGAAAQAVSSNSFAAFHGQSNLTAQYGLSYEQAHPNSGILCDPTEDGSQGSAHTAIDWASKGLYDPTSKRVFWASCGAGNDNVGLYIYNTMPFYDEAQNRWTVSRGFRGADEPATVGPIVHMYDGNAIDVAGRRFYRKRLGPKDIMVYDLSNNVWLNNLRYSSFEPAAYGGDVGMDFIPTTGKLWIRGMRSSDNGPLLFELNPATATSRIIAQGSTLGSDSAISGPCNYNPRAFGGAGACFVGGTNAYVVRCDTEAVASYASGKPSGAQNFMWPHRAHLCRDPVGDGWLYACADGFMYRLTSAGVWTQRAALPSQLTNFLANSIAIVMVPIDEHGVVWVISNANENGPRAWLYKP